MKGHVFSMRLETQWRYAANGVIGGTPIKTYTTHTSEAWNGVNVTVTPLGGTTTGDLRIVVASLNAQVFMDSFTLRP